MFSISMMAWFSSDGEREIIELVDRDLFTRASKGATFLHSFIFMAFDDILDGDNTLWKNNTRAIVHYKNT